MRSMIKGFRKASYDPRGAFPSGLYKEANNVCRSLPKPDSDPIRMFQVNVDGEELQIPYRVYYPDLNPTDIEAFSNIEESIAHCLYTRHHDGFVRQNHLESLFALDQKWVVPYVLQLLGEYVIEIIEVIRSKVSLLQGTIYSSFAEENPEFIEKVKSRIVSYWDCYYRQRFPRITEYPGYLVAKELNLWRSSDIWRIRAR
jgi:hypothetical protein